jgi:hypothetical protein
VPCLEGSCIDWHTRAGEKFKEETKYDCPSSILDSESTEYQNRAGEDTENDNIERSEPGNKQVRNYSADHTSAVYDCNLNPC